MLVIGPAVFGTFAEQPAVARAISKTTGSYGTASTTLAPRGGGKEATGSCEPHPRSVVQMTAFGCGNGGEAGRGDGAGDGPVSDPLGAEVVDEAIGAGGGDPSRGLVGGHYRIRSLLYAGRANWDLLGFSWGAIRSQEAEVRRSGRRRRTCRGVQASTLVA